MLDKMSAMKQYHDIKGVELIWKGIEMGFLTKDYQYSVIEEEHKTCAHFFFFFFLAIFKSNKLGQKRITNALDHENTLI